MATVQKNWQFDSTKREHVVGDYARVLVIMSILGQLRSDATAPELVALANRSLPLVPADAVETDPALGFYETVVWLESAAVEAAACVVTVRDHVQSIALSHPDAAVRLAAKRQLQNQWCNFGQSGPE
jgi:hypothetical protein